MRLHLIRHGKPDIAGGICYGSSDLAVAPEEHQRVVDALLPALPRDVPIYSSPLQRCRILAEIIARDTGAAKIECDLRLAEIDFGTWEMRAWDAIPRMEVDAWAADVVHYRPGNGESVLDVATRVLRFYEDLRISQAEEAIVVCHAGTIRLLQQCQHHALPENIAHAAGAVRHAIGYGERIVLDCNKNNSIPTARPRTM